MSELKNPKELPYEARPKARVELGVTLNLGDFNSLKCVITGDDTSRPNEDWEQTVDRVYDRVERKLMEKVREAKSSLEA